MKYKFLAFIVLLFLIVVGFGININKTFAGTTCNVTDNWQPAFQSWSSSSQTFTLYQTMDHDAGIGCESSPWISLGGQCYVDNLLRGSCIVNTQSGTCTVSGAVDGQENCGNGTPIVSPVALVDKTGPVCGTGWTNNGNGSYALTSASDALSGLSATNIYTCTATAGNRCSVTISDNAGNTNTCWSDYFNPPRFTVTASAVNGYVETPPINPQQVDSGSTATFHFNSGAGTTPTRGGTCPAGANPSYDPVNGYWYYTTGAITTSNCTVTMTFPSIPALSCAHDTNQAEPIYPNAGAKFRATGGTGTYSWSYSATSSAGNPTTGIEVWPAWTDSGTKTATVTSGAQTASCNVYITPIPATPVNGLCSNPDTHYTCSSPAASTNNVDGASSWTWTCPGSNGGTNDSCSEPKPLVMSGTLSPSSSTCSIPAEGTTCTKLLTWTTTNPVAVSAVTSATGTPSPSSSANNSSQTFTIPYNNGLGSVFYLYNNGVQLAQANVTPYCVGGTEWNGSVCETVVGPMPDLIASAPTPNIATVGVPQTFTSDISNVGGASTGASFSNFFQMASAANGGGTIADLASASTTALLNGATRAITSPSYTFGSAGTYSVRACADKSNAASVGTITELNETNNCSAWTDVTVSAVAGTVTGYHDAYNGTVPASQCRADGWAAYSSDLGLDLNIKILSDGVQVATGVASTYRGDLETAGACTGGTCSFWINLSGLISNGTNHVITAQAQNPSTGAWTTLPASPKTINCTAGTTGTLTASNCTIASGGSSCNSTLNWTTTNPVGTSNITSNTPSANTEITTGNSGTTTASVPYSSRTFFLNNNSVPLASATATASCVSGTSWDGSKCVDSAPACTNTPSFSGSISPTSVTYGGAYTVSCDYGVISDSIFPDVGSGSCAWAGFIGKAGTMANFNCTAGFVPGTFSNNCIINNSAPTYPYCSSVDPINNLVVTAPPAGTPIPGSCGTPHKHYSCVSPTPSTTNVNGISSWTWTCPGQDGGKDASCVESKKKPVIIED